MCCCYEGKSEEEAPAHKQLLGVGCWLAIIPIKSKTTLGIGRGVVDQSLEITVLHFSNCHRLLSSKGLNMIQRFLEWQLRLREDKANQDCDHLKLSNGWRSCCIKFGLKKTLLYQTILLKNTLVNEGS